MSRTLSKPPYSNCIIEAPDGQPLCRTGISRIEWYLKRDLGHIVNSDPLTLRLFKEPAGRDKADHPYLTAYKENICVVCGVGENITRHHVVPLCFRRFFPETKKTKSMHDVLILCVAHHDIYEKIANKKKQEMSEEIGVPMTFGREVDRYGVKVKMAASALINHYDKIPESKREVLKNIVRHYYAKQDITDDDLQEAMKIRKKVVECKPFGKKVVDGLDDLNEFIRMWRRHFVATMKPKHLPQHWDVNNDL